MSTALVGQRISWPGAVTGARNGFFYFFFGGRTFTYSRCQNKELLDRRAMYIIVYDGFTILNKIFILANRKI